MLSFLRIRVIVNGKTIVPLVNDQPVVIPSVEKKLVIVVTDGFHITPPLQLQFQEPSYYRFRITCAINDVQFYGGLLLLAVLYLLGFATGVLILKLVSFFPILLFVFLYYIKREAFIRITPVRY